MVRKAPKNTRYENIGQSGLPKTCSPYIGEIASLKRRSQRDEALRLLHEVAKLVSPIMKKHGFKVGKLNEFFPKDPRLLGINVNHGMKICIRLRPHHNENAFFPMESLIGTMLHELTHNKFGPHDEKFYAFLNGLESEYYDLIAKGWTGDGDPDGFNGVGHKLGGSAPGSIAAARKAAALKTEQRKILAQGSGQKLGGETNGKKSLQELIRQAAERRARDNEWCKAAETLSQEELGEDSDMEVTGVESIDKKGKKRAADEADWSNKVIIIEDDFGSPEHRHVEIPVIDLTED